MKKKLAWLLALVLLLAAMCAVAVGEDAEKVYTLTLGGGNSSHGAQTVDKKREEKITLRPARGTTINTFFFHQSDDYYWADQWLEDAVDMGSGKKIKNIIVTYYGKLKIKVETGRNWLDAYYSWSNNWFDVSVDKNDSAKQRVGTVVLSDSKGVVLRIKITQSSNVEIVSVKQLNGEKHDGEFRVQTTRAKGVTGKVIYRASGWLCWNCMCPSCCEACINGRCYECPDACPDCDVADSPEYYSPVKYTKGTVWFNKNLNINKFHFYAVGTYRVIAGRKHVSPLTENDLWVEDGPMLTH